MMSDIAIQFGQTVYGGTLNVTTGVLTIDRVYRVYTGTDEGWYAVPNKSWMFGIAAPEDIKQGGATSYYIKNCNMLEITSNFWSSSGYGILNNYGTIYVGMPNMADAAALKTYLASNNLQICYELATPTTVQLTPTDLQMLKGYNRLSSDGGGDITVEAYTGAAWGGDEA